MIHQYATQDSLFYEDTYRIMDFCDSRFASNRPSHDKKDENGQKQAVTLSSVEG